MNRITKYLEQRTDYPLGVRYIGDEADFKEALAKSESLEPVGRIYMQPQPDEPLVYVDQPPDFGALSVLLVFLTGLLCGLLLRG